MGEKSSRLIAIVGCLTVFMVPVFVTTLYYSYKDENNSCQEGKRAGLTLSDWLKVIGFTDLGILTLYYIAGLVGLMGDINVGRVIFFISAYAGLFAKFIIWVIGIVIVSTSENNKCIFKGTNIGIMAIVNLVLFISGYADLFAKIIRVIGTVIVSTSEKYFPH